MGLGHYFTAMDIHDPSAMLKEVFFMMKQSVYPMDRNGFPLRERNHLSTSKTQQIKRSPSPIIQPPTTKLETNVWHDQHG
jgi:hypothetical protein